MSQRIVENEIAVMGGKFDSPAMASDFIVPNVEGVNYPQIYDLGSNEGTSLISNGDITVVDNGNGTYTASVTNLTTGYLRFRHNLPSTRCLFEVSAVVTSGTCNVTDVVLAVNDHSPFIFDGDFSIVSDTVGDNNYQIYPTVGDSFEITFSFTLKEITLPTASYLTYPDITTGKHKQISSTGDAGENLIPEGDFSGMTLNGPEIGLSITDGILTVSDGDGINNESTASYGFATVIGREYSINYLAQDFSGTGLGLYVNGVGVGDYLWERQYKFVATSTSTNFYIFRYKTHTGSGVIPTISIREILPISTQYNIADTHQPPFNHTAPLSDEDLEALDLYPNLIYEVWFNEAVLLSGFSKADMGNFFDVNGDSKYIQDLSVDLGAEELTNWDFETDLTDWGGATRGVLVWDNGRGKFTVNGGETTGYFSHINNSVDTSSGSFIAFANINLGTATQIRITEKGGGAVHDFFTSGIHPFIIESTTAFQPIVTVYGDGAVAYVDYISTKVVSVVEILGAYTEANRNKNQNVGVTKFLLEQDASRTVGTSAEGEYRFANNDGRLIALGLKLNLKRWSMLEEFSGLIQNFGNDTKKLASSVNAGWVNNGDNTYTGTNVTDWIINVCSEDLSGKQLIGSVEILSITSGGVRNISNGSNLDTPLSSVVGVVNNVLDCTSSILYLRGEAFTGTVRINYIKELITKTQRRVKRVITHDEKAKRDVITSDSDNYIPVNSATFIDGVIEITQANDWAYFDTGYTGNAVKAVFEYEILETNDKILELCDSQPTTNRLLQADTVINGSLGIHKEIVTIDINGIARLGIGRYSNDGNSFIGKIANFSLTELVTEDKEYLDTVLQPNTPALPNPDTVINPTDTAILGYPDKITARHNDIKVSSDAWTQEEILENHNAWILENEDVFTDDLTGKYLTDDITGVYISI